MLFSLRRLFGFPDMARFQGGGGGHKDFAVEKGFCTLSRQGNGVGLFLGRARKLVHFVQKQVTYIRTGQIRRAVRSRQVHGHVGKL